MIDRIERRLFSTLRERLQEAPVLLLEGPRSVGKSTLLAEVSSTMPEARLFDFDDSTVFTLAQQSLSLITDEKVPVLIDEYQRIPAVLQAIKARLNKSTEAGMFVLAGSASYDSLPTGTQALTGRIQRLPVLPLTQTEIDGTMNRFVEQAFEGNIPHTADAATARRMDYVDRITRGGMPLALAQPDPLARGRWFAGHVRQSLLRDAGQLRQLGRAAALPKLLTRAAGQTGGLLNIAKAGGTLEISRTTATAYLELLESLFLISTLPAWGTTVSSRSIETPKIHVIDSGIGAHLLRLSRPKLERGDPSALTEFGHLVESFVVRDPPSSKLAERRHQLWPLAHTRRGRSRSGARASRRRRARFRDQGQRHHHLEADVRAAEAPRQARRRVHRWDRVPFRKPWVPRRGPDPQPPDRAALDLTRRCPRPQAVLIDAAPLNRLLATLGC